MSGTVNIARSIFDHAIFADEPKTEREAWIWLVMEASWKPREKRVGKVVVQTERGQLATSIRFLAGAWKWTAPKVQRYLKRLEKASMIVTSADTGVSVLTICNYDEYQAGGKASDTAAIQKRYSSDTNDKKGERREEGKKEKDADASLSVPAQSGPSFDDFWNVWPLGKISKANAAKAFAKLSQQDRSLATERALTWAAQWRRNNPSASPIHPASYLNGKRWTDEIQPNLTLIAGGPRDQFAREDRRPASAVHATDRAIAFAARAGRSPREDCF